MGLGTYEIKVALEGENFLDDDQLARWLLPGHRKGVAEANSTDPFVSADEIDVDEKTSAAIDRGIRAADEGRVVPSDEVRKLIPQWISKFSSPKQR